MNSLMTRKEGQMRTLEIQPVEYSQDTLLLVLDQIESVYRRVDVTYPVRHSNGFFGTKPKEPLKPITKYMVTIMFVSQHPMHFFYSSESLQEQVYEQIRKALRGVRT